MESTKAKPIKGLPGYVITPDNYVYSMSSCRKLKRRWYKQEWYSGIRVNQKTFYLSHRELSSPLFDMENVIKEDSPEAICDETRNIPGFPAYEVSKDGKVWRVKPYKRNNRGRKTPFQLKIRKHHGSDYYKLTAEDGKISIRRVARIVGECWPESEQ